MLRSVLMVLVPLAAPTVIYLVYMLAVERRRLLAGRGVPQPWWVEAPWVPLAAGGVALTALVLITWTFVGGGDPGEVYVPAHVIDGEIVPGAMKPEGGAGEAEVR